LALVVAIAVAAAKLIKAKAVNLDLVNIGILQPRILRNRNGPHGSSTEWDENRFEAPPPIVLHAHVSALVDGSFLAELHCGTVG
jgi:hypothetical protein